jgi:hypothetical protein
MATPATVLRPERKHKSSRPSAAERAPRFGCRSLSWHVDPYVIARPGETVESEIELDPLT